MKITMARKKPTSHQLLMMVLRLIKRMRKWLNTIREMMPMVKPAAAAAPLAVAMAVNVKGRNSKRGSRLRKWNRDRTLRKLIN